jgi:hypothetical protein
MGTVAILPVTAERDRSNATSIRDIGLTALWVWLGWLRDATVWEQRAGLSGAKRELEREAFHRGGTSTTL